MVIYSWTKKNFWHLRGTGQLVEGQPVEAKEDVGKVVPLGKPVFGKRLSLDEKLSFPLDFSELYSRQHYYRMGW